MSSHIFSLNTKYLYSETNTSDNFLIKPRTVQNNLVKIKESIDKTESKLANNKYGFVSQLSKINFFQMKDALDSIKWAKFLVVVGIGGSDLGTRAIEQALDKRQAPMEVLFAGDSTDPISFERLFQKINLNDTVFNIVSKSGKTLETLSAYVFLKGIIKKITDQWQEHFIFTTDDDFGILRKEASENNVLTLNIPDDVGGRFSVLTPVGLLPALAMGVDIKNLVKGARELAVDSTQRKLSQDFAKGQFELYSQNIKISVLMPYSVQLQEFARWFRQLWAESLGKDDKGVLPVVAWGPADQHSQGQFYNQGSPVLSILFLKIKERKTNYVLKNVDLEAAKYLEGHNFNEVLNMECEASVESVHNNLRPVAVLEVGLLNAYSLGQLFMFFELAVVYLAEMLEVNAFDQPGVEMGKKIIKEQLSY